MQTQTNSRSTRALLLIIILSGMGIRIAWGLRQPGDLSALPDQKEYIDLARHLLSHEGFWFADPRFGDVVYAYRTPGYPAFIAMCGGSLRIVRIAQALLDASTILAVYLLARRWLDERASVFAAALIAFNPYLIYFSGTLLSETLFTAMLMWGIALLVLSDGPWPAKTSRLFVWLGGAVLLTLSIIVRPGALLLPVFLAVGAALLNRRDGRTYLKWWPLPVATTMLVLMCAVLLGWAMRNRVQLGAWIWTSTNEGITRYDGFNPDATGASDQRFVDRMPWLASMSEVGRSQYLNEKADEYIRAEPVRSLELAAIKIARTWSPVPLSNEFGRPLYVCIGAVYGTIFYVLILIGLWARVLPAPSKRYLLLPALYFTAGAALSVGSLRYRIPAEPPMAILAACVSNRSR